ncbi:MFS transporter [Actinoplanes friuliensis]|uniref:Major facilitator transporter n=1 Tax=Actinoplanes friuliensis DSM 7358 TaxID=1246995 RepID=U5W7R6_9ACTN|nr:MFS transporter [Actinoplanes friuliensis]AGZ45169.1 major facilitator transporter [Actinoplanes friuliensis DSM 7358]
MRGFGVWLGAATVSLLGTQVLAFAMAWIAAGRGGTFAALVLTAINLPRVLLLLAGGAVADRFGAWRVMIAADVLMTVVMLGLVGAAARFGEQPVLLVTSALAVGVVDAFYLPASGAMPRLLVPGDGLPRALAARQLAGQAVAFAGPPLGGVVVAAAGLAAAALANAASFALVAVVLIALRRPVRPAARSPIMDGWRTAFADPVLRPALLLTAAAAAFLLPVSGLLVPLLARQRDWPATAGGAVAGTIALGTAVMVGAVLIWGAHRRPARAAVAGLLVAATGTALLALSPAAGAAVAAGFLTGLGTGLFSAHIAPLVLGTAPSTHLARVQAVLVLTQSVPLLITNNVLGGIADRVPVSTVLLACAAALATATVATRAREAA